MYFFCKCSQSCAIIYLDASVRLQICSHLPAQIFCRNAFPPFSVNILPPAFVGKKMFWPKLVKIEIYKHFIELIKCNFSLVSQRSGTFCSLQHLWEGQYYFYKTFSSMGL